MSAKTVFISYRRDVAGKSFARSLKTSLEHRGYDVFLDVDCIDAGAWASQILVEVPRRAHFLLLLTPGALDRCADADDWVRREYELAQKNGRNIVPVREESIDPAVMVKSCHASMRGVFDLQIADLRHGSFEADIAALVKRFIAAHKAPPIKPPESPAVPKVDISRIIKYAPAELIGRESELKLLNEVWTKVQNKEKGRPRILTFVALGGEGKTSLVAKWAAELASQGWPGCDAVFGWSFYSMGTRDQHAASSDLFLKEAITFFGDEEDKIFAAGNASAYEKGQRLARLVGQRRSLLILDGLEPLQYPPTSTAFAAGQLKDEAIAKLLKDLSTNSQGLCIVTTRYSLPDLKVFWQTTAPEVKLLRLSRNAGVYLLKSLGVKGSVLRNIPLKEGDEKSEKVNEFEKLVEDVKGHALTLTLFGSYLRDAHAGDIRKRDLVKLEEADDEEQGGHAFHVMDAYVYWLETGGKNEEENKKGQRALSILRLLGLFDRPVTADCFYTLLKAPAIPNLTELLIKKKEEPRQIAISRLESAKLIMVNRDASGGLLSLDTHPLLRAYFAEQLRVQYPGSWREAHRRLYKHLISITEEGDQPTLEDIQPLYQAVAHGCQAGLQQEACDKVYRDRILRGIHENHSARKLGALTSDLGAVACFFEQPWTCISSSLIESAQAWLLNNAAYYLRGLGRLTESLELMRTGVKMNVEQENWSDAAICASNLSQIELTLGEVAGAMVDAEQSVTYADRSGSAFWKMASCCQIADVLHQTDRRAEAETHFREAEQMQQEMQPDFPLLYTLQGFMFCDLLLATSERAAWQRTLECGDLSPLFKNAGNSEAALQSRRFPKSADESAHSKTCRAVSQRAAQTLKWVEEENWLLSIALDHLTIGREMLYRSILEQGITENSKFEIEQAVNHIRRSNQQQYLPHCLLTRAWLRFLTGTNIGPESAQSDLDEAWEIAERGPMRLFMADIHLYRARLFFRETQYPWESPQADLAAAEKLINDCGYHRRDEELADAKAAILGTKSQ